MSSSATIVARLVHLSDLHFGLKDPQSVWDLLHKHVTSMAPAPTGIVVTGDIVNTPKEAHFKKAVSALRSFGAIPNLKITAGRNLPTPRGRTKIFTRKLKTRSPFPARRVFMIPLVSSPI